MSVAVGSSSKRLPLDEPLVFPSSPSPEPQSIALDFGAPTDLLLDDDTHDASSTTSPADDEELVPSSSTSIVPDDQPFGDCLLDDDDDDAAAGNNKPPDDFQFGEANCLLDEDETMQTEEQLHDVLSNESRVEQPTTSHREAIDDIPNPTDDLFAGPSASSTSTADAAFSSFGGLFSTQPSSSSTSISARSFSGRPVTFRRRKRDGEASSSRHSEKHHHPHNMQTLLEVPVHRLMDRLSETTAAKINTDIVASPADHDKSKPQGKSIPAASMWVDKYRPKRFTDLVGDESVHRETLSWLKEWDQCVFKRKPTKSNKRSRAEKDAAAVDDQPQRAPDEYGRPYEKILLLAGPPGLGKTTLAHVVASQAGYSVLEINASDARTGNIVDERIKPALETGQGLGRKKPVLVVVDEVDGATGEHNGGFVSRLIQLTIDSRKKRRPGEKRDPRDKQPLLRPIICICNDLYAPAISKLRSSCRIVRFNPAAPAQLTRRLREICDTEGLQADTRGLSLLVGVCKGDLRGCLNTLQMIHTRKQVVTEARVREATVGMKEAETTNQAVWNDLFLPLSKKRVKDLGMDAVEQEKYVGRLARLVEASGAADKIVGGCFHHYTNLHQQDPSWDRSNKFHAWIGAFDLFSSVMRLEQEYAMLAYLPYLVVPVHPLYVDPDNTKVSRPTADWECHVKMKASEEIYKSLSMAVVSDHGRHTASFRHLLGKEVMVAEFAPILNRIISPPIRPVNSQVIKPQERAVLKKLVNVMVSLELRFVQEKGEDGQLMYRLDPPIDIFVTYEGKRPTDIAVSKYAVRHMVAAEIEAEYAARHADAVEKNQGKKVATFFGRNKRAPIAQEEDEGDGDAAVPPDAPEDAPGDALTRLPADASSAVKKKGEEKGKVIDIADKPPVDFFGRPLIPKKPKVEKTTAAAAKNAEELGPPTKKFKVTYRFNEGASAAVRKPVKLQSLL